MPLSIIDSTSPTGDSDDMFVELKIGEKSETTKWFCALEIEGVVRDMMRGDKSNGDATPVWPIVTLVKGSRWDEGIYDDGGGGGGDVYPAKVELARRDGVKPRVSRLRLVGGHTTGLRSEGTQAVAEAEPGSGLAHREDEDALKVGNVGISGG